MVYGIYRTKEEMVKVINDLSLVRHFCNGSGNILNAMTSDVDALARTGIALHELVSSLLSAARAVMNDPAAHSQAQQLASQLVSEIEAVVGKGEGR